MQEHGVEVIVVSLFDEKDDVIHQDARQIKVHYLNDLDTISSFVIDNNVTHIHSHFGHDATAMAYRVSQKTGVEFSFTTHAFDLYKTVSPDLRKWCEAARCVFTISEYNKRYMRDVLGIDDVRVVRCGVFPSKIVPKDYAAEPFRIVTACRNVEKKGLKILAQACRELKRRGVDFTCEIVTDGEIDAPEVTVRPPMPHPEIADFISSGSVFVLPCVKARNGDQDGIPVTLMEAMSLRIPVVSTAISGIPELITNGENGLLVKPEDVNELVDAILEIKNNASLVDKLRGCSRERVLQSYNIQANAKKKLNDLAIDYPDISDFHLPDIQFCNSRSHHCSIEYAGLSNVFNPSFSNDGRVVAFRAIPDGDDRLNSYISVNGVLHNLSSKAISYGCLQFIDPKVFTIRGEHYVTFNSGHVSDGNDIFVMKVSPDIEEPVKVTYRRRQWQERNWAFFEEDGEVYALYGLNPLKTLRRINANGSWDFDDYRIGDSSHDLSIGTQLAQYGKQYYFVAHQKQLVKGKKLYLGRAACFDFQAMSISLGKWLAHSPESLEGSPVKHNGNLFSCTYFSGIQVNDGEVLLGYGVNDVCYGFSRHMTSDFTDSNIYQMRTSWQ